MGFGGEIKLLGIEAELTCFKSWYHEDVFDEVAEVLVLVAHDREELVHFAWRKCHP